MEENPWKNRIIVILLVVLLCVVGALAYLLVQQKDAKKETEQRVEELELQAEQLQMDKEQSELDNDYDELAAEFIQLDRQVSNLPSPSEIKAPNDSVRREYEKAKRRVEELRDEIKKLKDSNQLSKAKIAELQAEIGTLKDLLRHYIEQIDQLNKENSELRERTSSLEQRNSELNTRVSESSARNEELTQKVQLAEKLNVSGVSLQALNKKGKTEKHVAKAKQLKVSFTIPQNNSTPVGVKHFYCRITTPEGNLLRGGGSFSFEGASLEATASKSVEYDGSEVPGVTIYWNNNATLTPGSYRVELFVDNYRVASRSFELSK